MEQRNGYLRIGVSMRVTKAVDYYEKRDALSQDWQIFLSEYLPEAISMPLPNLGKQIIKDVVEPWQINAFILTGGDDLGIFPERDVTETEILTYAIAHQLPVLAVCRGFQLLQTYFGGILSECDRDIHMATHHKVIAGKINFEVNSYHTKSVLTENLAPHLKVIALAQDGGVEAAAIKDKPVLALMWHPEREDRVTEFESGLIRQLFLDPATFNTMKQ